MNHLGHHGHDTIHVELPMPEDHFRRLGLGSRATFYRWEKDGLRIVRVGGRRFIYASDLKEFLERKNNESASASTLAKS